MSDVRAITRSVHTAEEWINELSQDLDTEQAHAYTILKAFMHTLRDRLPTNESAQLASQLPVLLRGSYYEGWRPSQTPKKYHQPEEFLERVAREARLPSPTVAAQATQASMRLMKHHVSAGELADVIAVLPEPINQMLLG
jgi:uncharacterized protein (DUF2267 family)